MKKKRGCGAAAAGAALVLGMVGSAQGAPVYAIATLGLTDTDHVRAADGYRFSSTQPIYYQVLSAAGQAIGLSRRYTTSPDYSGSSIWLYKDGVTHNIGLTDAEHTGTDRYRVSRANAMNDAGQAIGYAQRFTTLGVYNGQSAWLYNGAITQNISLTDAEHAGTDGYRYSDASSLNDGGQAIGYSYRYTSSGNENGISAWLYNGSGTANIGLTDAEHTGTNDYRHSEARALNKAGQAVGYSSRQSSGTGRTAWLYNGAITQNIGLTDTEHTGTNGYRYSDASSLNDAGQAIGFSSRYTPSGASNGDSAWLYNGTVTQNIGLTDTEHTSTTGERISIAHTLNATGQAIGYSSRYSTSGLANGRSAWLYNGTVTQNIGLTDAEHTGIDGSRYSDASSLNDAGQAIGYSYRYASSGNDNGISAWLYNGSGTANIGLTDAAHTDNTSGYRYSWASALNNTGHAIGSSSRYSTSGLPNGRSAWLYNGTVTQNIGLTDAAHTGINGYQWSEATSAAYYYPALNDAGQAIGHSVRYNAIGNENGQDAWFYDSATDTTYSLKLSERSDGYAYGIATYLGDDGLVLGLYKLFDGASDKGNRAFYFTMADGVLDLGSLVQGGLDSAGWLYLAGAIRANGIGQIVGEGFLNDPAGSQMIFLLAPVPLPGAFWLFGSALGLAGFGYSRRRIH